MKINQRIVDLKNGLDDQQVLFQRNAGLINRTRNRITPSAWKIIQNNTFTLFNLINIVLAFFVFETGSYRNMLFLVIAVANTVIGTFQELRSKRKIDQLALLSQGQPHVVRNGKVTPIKIEDIVQGDLLSLRLGDQVPVDGEVISTHDLEVDESQITGEMTSIHKKNGDNITSGSNIISGNATILATKVGNESFVNRISQEAQGVKDRNGAMLNAINRIIKILTFIIIPLGIVLFTSRVLHGSSVNKAVLGTTAAMIGMIPEGLVLLSSVTMAVSAMKLTRKRVLVRNLPAIETLARVDTLCLDKTGTLTSGKLSVKRLINSSSWSDEQLKAMIGKVVATIGDDNATAIALKQAFPGAAVKDAPIMSFSSERKWSGVTINNHNYILGAPTFVMSQIDAKVKQVIDNYADQGYRVLAIAENDGLLKQPLKNVSLLGLVLIKDQIRPNAERTLSYLKQQGITINVISGDDPRTVSQIAKTVKIDGADKLIDLSKVKNPNYKKLILNYHVFGRVTPQQKEALMKAYQDLNHVVAMTGDGVNDLLALKQADCGIAMAAGNDSTQSVANFVLIDSDFDAMIPVLKEGRRVINNISSVSSLYLIKTMYSLFLSLLFIFAHRDYPFQPIQLTPISTFMIGIPSFILAFEPNFERVVDQFSLKIRRIALPAAICIVSYVIMITLIGHFMILKFANTSTLNVLATGIICWLALLEVNQPMNRFKRIVTYLTGAGFLVLFFAFGPVFLLASIWHMPILIIAILIVVSAFPFFKLVKKIVIQVMRLFQIKFKKKNSKI